jgi:hypothetical protein
MRTVRVQVYARQKYRSKDGHFDTRALMLEAEIESFDGSMEAIWELQRQADTALNSWIDLYSEEKSPDPIEPAPPLNPSSDSDGTMPF